MLASCGAVGSGQPSRVEIAAHEGGFRLLFNANPYFVKGAAGDQYLDKLLETGGNSMRLLEVTAPALEEAPPFGLTALAGIPLRAPGTDLDYTDAVAVAVQFERVKQTVRRYRNHPALLMWALGNEPELEASPEDRRLLWKAVEELAAMVKQEDPNHPVIAVIGGTGDGKVSELVEHCPSLDALGINVRGQAGAIAESMAEQGWTKPYLVTQIGPRRPRDVEDTAWGIPFEHHSTAKAAQYREIYEKAVRDQPSCLGSYAFLWGDGHEGTHTWNGMFLPDGAATAAVDVMTHAWTGKWPINRAPEIGPAKVVLTLEGAATDDRRRQFLPGATVHAFVDASDPDEDPLIVKWEVRRDIPDPEEPPVIMFDAVRTKRHTRAVIQIPDAPANYRLFVYVYDPKGSAATINVPFVAAEGR